MTKTYQEHEPRRYTNNDGYLCSTYGNDSITRKFKKALELHEEYSSANYRVLEHWSNNRRFIFEHIGRCGWGYFYEGNIEVERMSWEADNFDNERLDRMFDCARHFIETGEVKSLKSIWQ